VIFCESNFTAGQAAEMGGEEKIFAHMHDLCEELFPGWHEAIDATVGVEHRHMWTGPMFAGPKIPRRIPSVDGLWYVADSSVPVFGLGLDAAASTGYMGAHEMLEALRSASGTRTA
jgi:hypothetical protein